MLSDLMDISQAEAVIDILQGGLPVPVLGPAGLIAFIAILLITALFLTRRGQVQGA